MYSVNYILRNITYKWLVIGMMTIAFMSSVSAESTPEYTPEVIKVEFKLVNGLILVQASIDGVTGPYVFDTGAPRVLINQNVQTSEFMLWTATGDIKSRELPIESFRFGDLEKNGLSAWAANLTHIEEMINHPVAGIIGSEILTDYKILVDYEQSELMLMPAETMDVEFAPMDYDVTSLPFEIIDSDLLVVKVGLNGEDRNFVFDTGAAINVINSSDGSEVSDLEESFHHRTLEINKVKIQQSPFVTFSMDELSDSSDVTLDGILSVSSLSTSKVLIDYSTSKIHMFWKKEVEKIIQ